MSEATDGPRLRDSDLVYLAIRRMERVADKMQKLEYDEELNMHLADAAEWMDYLQNIIGTRPEEQEPRP